ncbi:hypothetical protein JCM19240_3978 [Vibrio maritimus]|uniref:Uncharacterized protein n=1 Tax=Vibrio maritimus TaxID=990268 RepID=A0A090U606_9VIBR|nr:hypothetical protein JCM19240_3978 [Vibrio maritimus]
MKRLALAAALISASASAHWQAPISVDKFTADGARLPITIDVGSDDKDITPQIEVDGVILGTMTTIRKGDKGEATVNLNAKHGTTEVCTLVEHEAVNTRVCTLVNVTTPTGGR